MGQYGNHRDPGSRSDFGRLNVVLLIVAAAIPVVLFLVRWHLSPTGQAYLSSLANTIGAEQDSGINARIPMVSTAFRPSPIFPYSVIPGGAHSDAELKSALLHDPVAAAHYAGFDVARTHVIRLSHAERVYVSYRIGSSIYWTSRRLYIPAGETLLSDGEHEARTRCGNRLSEIPESPVSAREPVAGVLNGPAVAVPAVTVTDTLVASALVNPEMDLGTIVGSSPDGGKLWSPPLIPIIGGPGIPPLSPSKNPPPIVSQPPIGPPPPPPIAATPEPPSSLLFLLSGSVLGLFALRRKLRHKRGSTASA